MMGKNEETIEEKIVKTLLDKNLIITTAESCTGGMVASRLIDIPGISAVYKEGYITYSNEAKQKILGVRVRTLNEYGAVSNATAFEMAKGVCQKTGADVGVSVTGVAGPNTDVTDKPIGLVYVGCCVNRITKVIEKHFSGKRSEIREQATTAALELLEECLIAEA